MSIDINVYDTASAISQIDCNEWVKLQDVESIIAKVREDERLRLLWIVDDTIEHRDNCNLFITMDGDCDCGKNDLLNILMGKS